MEKKMADRRDAPRDVDRQKAASRPAPAVAPLVGGKVEAPPVDAGRGANVAEERARSQAAPAAEPRADASQPRRPATAPSAVMSFAPPDVSGRLAGSERDAALHGLPELRTRPRAGQSPPVAAPQGTTIEPTIPPQAYPAIVPRLRALG